MLRPFSSSFARRIEQTREGESNCNGECFSLPSVNCMSLQLSLLPFRTSYISG